jgi:broad specificity phosphatase PhoE
MSVLNDLWIVRHGQTEWSATGRPTSRTDVPLTDTGLADARRLAPALAAHHFALVLTSPMQRARDTATATGFPDAVVDDDLREWDYGDLEGLTTPEIRARGGEFAQWTIWRGPVPGGETLADVAARAGRVLDRVAAAAPDGAGTPDVVADVVCFGHGHASRVLVAVALGLAPENCSRFLLEPATIGIVGSEHDQRALRIWNAPPV